MGQPRGSPPALPSAPPDPQTPSRPSGEAAAGLERHRPPCPPPIPAPSPAASVSGSRRAASTPVMCLHPPSLRLQLRGDGPSSPSGGSGASRQPGCPPPPLAASQAPGLRQARRKRAEDGWSPAWGRGCLCDPGLSPPAGRPLHDSRHGHRPPRGRCAHGAKLLRGSTGFRVGEGPRTKGDLGVLAASRLSVPEQVHT